MHTPHVHSRIILGLLVAAIIGTALLTILVRFNVIPGFDVAISQEVQEDRDRGLLLVMEAVSVFGIPWVAISTTAVVALSFLAASLRREALYAAATLGTGVVNALVKALFNRPRPTDTLITVYQKLSDPSFPSGHVVYYVVFFGFLIAAMALAPRIPRALRIAVGSLSAALIVLVSVSRLYLGVHWATDVVGGYCIGLALLAGLLHFYLKSASPDM